MTDVLQLDIATTLTGPLAERLVQIAGLAHKTPVDALADMIERLLKDDTKVAEQRQVRAARTQTLEKQVTALTDEHQRVCREVVTLKKELADLRSRYQTTIDRLPPAGALVILPCLDAVTRLGRAADSRKLKSDQLARMVLEQVCADDLFAAVLDT